MARKRTPLIKHILITAGLGAGLVAFGGSFSEAQAQSCDRGDYYQTPTYYSNGGYTYAHRPAKRYRHHQRYQRHDHRYKARRRHDLRQRRRITRRMFRSLDYNRDGWISRYEARHSRILRERFWRVDRDHDGFIGRRELRRHLRWMQRRGIL